jgi:hypothetical protein
VAITHGFGLRGTQRLLHFLCEAIDVHYHAVL